MFHVPTFLNLRMCFGVSIRKYVCKHNSMKTPADRRQKSEKPSNDGNIQSKVNNILINKENCDVNQYFPNIAG